ncbi:hypothetical protein K7I13_10090 [Brucepastera parasyntrophica]|uniref:hypothetical protein n=1 Tax=Brucepastera parasyntrophica TaxID=2880008 RepID=UPI00210D5069|nr:hypothetical protein [Brucepastera parasyntrophica]ULQ58876.1 hypothetical protein K7I13_10090 [Brucepastera parasyntrophica]
MEPIKTAAEQRGIKPSPRINNRQNPFLYGAGSAEDSAFRNDIYLAQRKNSQDTAPAETRQIKKIPAGYEQYAVLLNDSLALFDYEGAFSAYNEIFSLLQNDASFRKEIDENRNKIIRSLDLLSIEAVSSPDETIAGRAFKKDFSVKISAENDGTVLPVAGLLCAVSCPANPEPSGAAAKQLKTDGSGVVSFSAPVPAFSGKNNLVIFPAFETSDPVLSDYINKKIESGTLSAIFPHIVATNKKSISTSISILDYDRNGKPVLNSNVSSTALLMPLVQKGFSRIGMADFPGQLASGDEDALIRAAAAQFGTGVQRLIYGTVKLTDISQAEDTSWNCTAVANISVWDFTSAVKTFETVIDYTATAKTANAAIDLARKKISGEMLPEELLYNL